MVTEIELSAEEQKEITGAFRQFNMMVLLFIGMVMGVLVFLHTNTTSFGRHGAFSKNWVLLVSALSLVAVSLLGVGFFFRKVLMHKKLTEPLADSESAAVKKAAQVYKSLYVTTWAMGESIWVFGLVLFVLGVPLIATYHFFALALFHVLWLRPNKAELESYMLLQKGFQRQT